MVAAVPESSTQRKCKNILCRPLSEFHRFQPSLVPSRLTTRLSTGASIQSARLRSNSYKACSNDIAQTSQLHNPEIHPTIHHISQVLAHLVIRDPFPRSKESDSGINRHNAPNSIDDDEKFGKLYRKQDFGERGLPDSQYLGLTEVVEKQLPCTRDKVVTGHARYSGRPRQLKATLKLEVRVWLNVRQFLHYSLMMGSNGHSASEDTAANKLSFIGCDTLSQYVHNPPSPDPYLLRTDPLDRVCAPIATTAMTLARGSLARV
ncbi:hypothetical protein HOY82DRAFT_590949 [Tuber indicum]|nr:hypothetical protein HOY82DRAFT_590949 [Tuber indicum]